MSELVHRLSMQTINIRAKLPPALPFRIWLGSQLMKAAALVIGCGIEIETKERT